MILKIQEIKQRANHRDRVEIKGKVKRVFDFQEKKMEYSIGYQNCIVEDDTGEIRTSSFINSERDIIPKSYEGQVVEVLGEFDIYQKDTGEKLYSISKAKFVKVEEVEEVTKVEEKVMEKTNQISVKDKVKILCLAVEFMKHNYTRGQCDSKELVNLARYFEQNYINYENKEEVYELAQQLTDLAKEKKNGNQFIEDIMKDNNIIVLTELSAPELKAYYLKLKKSPGLEEVVY